MPALSRGTQDDVAADSPVDMRARSSSHSAEAHTPRPHPPIEEPEEHPEQHAPETEPDSEPDPGSDPRRHPPRPGKAPR